MSCWDQVTIVEDVFLLEKGDAVWLLVQDSFQLVDLWALLYLDELELKACQKLSVDKNCDNQGRKYYLYEV